VKPAIERLRAEIRSDREAVERWLDELAGLELEEEADRARLAQAAWAPSLVSTGTSPHVQRGRVRGACRSSKLASPRQTKLQGRIVGVVGQVVTRPDDHPLGSHLVDPVDSLDRRGAARAGAARSQTPSAAGTTLGSASGRCWSNGSPPMAWTLPRSNGSSCRRGIAGVRRRTGEGQIDGTLRP
jgi:hypothetical protein